MPLIFNLQYALIGLLKTNWIGHLMLVFQKMPLEKEQGMPKKNLFEKLLKKWYFRNFI